MPRWRPCICEFQNHLPWVDSVRIQVALGSQLPIFTSLQSWGSDPMMQLSGPLAVLFFTYWSLVSYEFGWPKKKSIYNINNSNNKKWQLKDYSVAYYVPDWDEQFMEHLVSSVPSSCEASTVTVPSHGWRAWGAKRLLYLLKLRRVRAGISAHVSWLQGPPFTTGLSNIALSVCRALF